MPTSRARDNSSRLGHPQNLALAAKTKLETRAFHEKSKQRTGEAHVGTAGGGGGAAHVEEQLLGEVPLAATLQGADQAAARHHVRVHAPRLHVPEHLRGDMGGVVT